MKTKEVIGPVELSDVLKAATNEAERMWNVLIAIADEGGRPRRLSRRRGSASSCVAMKKAHTSPLVARNRSNTKT